jgi:SAM-dependent methyltransferase
MKEKLRKLKRFYRINKKIIQDLHVYQQAELLTVQEYAKKPRRFDIINFLLTSLNRETSYFEIGVRKPNDNFNKIKASKKYSVDPGLEFEENPVDFKLTSDEFFLALKQGALDIDSSFKFDVIFIDGLHLAEQVNKDIENALGVLKDDGYIVLHDCNPPTFAHAREDFYYHSSPAFGSWNGTTWKAFLKARYRTDISSCTVDTDWGVGIISKSKKLCPPPKSLNEFYEYNNFAANRSDQLGLISFVELENLITTI